MLTLSDVTGPSQAISVKLLRDQSVRYCLGSPTEMSLNMKQLQTRRGGRKNSKQFRKNNKYVILNEAGRFASDKLRARLIYQDPTIIRTATGSSQAMNWHYRSSAYDPDPLLLTGAIPGFAELANHYFEYCVHSMTMELDLGNQNTETIIAVIWPSNVGQNSNSLTYTDIQEYSGNVRAKSTLIGGANGYSIGSLRSIASGEQLVGSRFRTDLDYSASVSTNPAQMFYLNVGIIDCVAPFTYGVAVKARIIYDVEFFKLRQLEN